MAKNKYSHSERKYRRNVRKDWIQVRPKPRRHILNPTDPCGASGMGAQWCLVMISNYSGSHAQIAMLLTVPGRGLYNYSWVIHQSYYKGRQLGSFSTIVKSLHLGHACGFLGISPAPDIFLTP